MSVLIRVGDKCAIRASEIRLARIDERDPRRIIIMFRGLPSSDQFTITNDTPEVAARAVKEIFNAMAGSGQ